VRATGDLGHDAAEPACSSTLLAIASTSSSSPRNDADTRLVTRRLDAQHQGLLAVHRRISCSPNNFRRTKASISPGW
jgi:hypothetical protein